MAKRRTPAAKSEPVSVFSRERVTSYLRQLYNPLVNLTPEALKLQHSAFDAGNLRQFALTMAQMVRKDDLLPGVVGKRIKAPSVRGYEILTTEKSDRADLHKKTLEDFYNNLNVTNAVDENERGGVALLLRQMMEAVGYRYALHEVVWQPSPDFITAEVRYAPLNFFENTTGRLRFLPSDGALYGTDLEPGRWLVTVGEGLMFSCSIAYLFKHYPMRDWLIYCGRHGMPGIGGRTKSAYGSAEWKAMESAVANFAAEFAAVYSDGDSIDKIDLTAQGELPYPKLIERMDRMMAALWRGADLSTMSGGGPDSSGASLQGEESQILEASDAMMLSEALNEYLDTWAIRYYLGDEEPLAYIQVKTSTRRNIEQDLKVDQQLHTMRFPLSLQSLSERYGRPLPDEGEDLLPPPPTQAQIPPVVAAANASKDDQRVITDDGAAGAIMAETRMVVGKELRSDLKPIADRVSGIIAYIDSGASPEEVENAVGMFLRVELPVLARELLKEPSLVDAYVNAMSAAMANGIEAAAKGVAT